MRTTIAASLFFFMPTFGCGSDSTSQGGAGAATTTGGNAVTSGATASVTSVGGSSNEGTTSPADSATSSTGASGSTGTSGTAGATNTAGTGTIAAGGANGATTSAGGTGGSTGGATATEDASSTSATGGSGGSTESACTRASLQAAADSLADALASADPTRMALDPGATYVENAQASDFSQGVWQGASEIAFQRDFLDVETCETFSEIVVTQGVPLVLGVRLTLTGSNVSAVTALVTDEDDWAFDAANYAAVSSAEDWSAIPEGERDTRETLIAAGNAYFDLFNDKSVMVPWNTPCTRLEGGQFTTGNTCDVGVPDGITFADKHWVVDRDLGTAVGMVRFGGANGLPDSHMFRCLQGKIRYVHTITVCDGNC